MAQRGPYDNPLASALTDACPNTRMTPTASAPLPNSGTKGKKHRSKAAAVTIVDGFFACATCGKCVGKAMMVGSRNARTYCFDCYPTAAGETRTRSTADPSTVEEQRNTYANSVQVHDAEGGTVSDVAVRRKSPSRPLARCESAAPPSIATSQGVNDDSLDRSIQLNVEDAFTARDPRVMVDVLLTAESNASLVNEAAASEKQHDVVKSAGTSLAPQKTKAKRRLVVPLPTIEPKEVKVFFHSRLPRDAQLLSVRDLSQLQVANLRELYMDHLQPFDERSMDSFMIGALCPALIAKNSDVELAYACTASGSSEDDCIVLHNTSTEIWEAIETPESSESESSFSHAGRILSAVEKAKELREYENTLYRDGLFEMALRETGSAVAKETEKHVMHLLQDRVTLKKSGEWNSFLDERVAASGKHCPIHVTAPHEVHVFLGFSAHDTVVSTPPLRLLVERCHQRVTEAPFKVPLLLPRDQFFLSHLRLRALFGWKHGVLLTPFPPAHFAVSCAQHQFEILRLLKCISSTSTIGDCSSYSFAHQTSQPAASHDPMERMPWFQTAPTDLSQLRQEDSAKGDDPTVGERETITHRMSSRVSENETTVSVKCVCDLSDAEKLAEQRSTYRLRVATRDTEVVQFLHKELQPTR